MSKIGIAFALSGAILSIAAMPVLAAAGGSQVTGSLTVNSEKVALLYAYADEAPDNIIVVLASKEVPDDVLPFIGEEVARKQKIHAVAFTISRAERSLARDFGGVFFPGAEMGFVGLPEGAAKLEVKRLDATGLAGRIYTPKPFTALDTAFGFDVTFSMPLGSAVPPKPAPTITVTGDSSAPSKVYADYYRASFSGDMAKIRPFIAADRLKEMDAAPPEMLEMMFEMLKSQPHDITITKATVAGSKATLLVEALNQTTEQMTAEVSMVLEKGAWKIAKESWKTTSK